MDISVTPQRLVTLNSKVRKVSAAHIKTDLFVKAKTVVVTVPPKDARGLCLNVFLSVFHKLS
jgi:hypothetical protein